MDPAGFGAIVIVPAAPVLVFFAARAPCVEVRPRPRARRAAGLARVPCPLTVRFAPRCAPVRTGAHGALVRMAGCVRL
ncbi:hypothetical protein [Streptomyces sp. NPDC059389]|uniref:hypothetical protein n=1 Tax=Streptomyces sp. NPDC059389 TaxID=3346818 RepID=UPI00368F23FA